MKEVTLQKKNTEPALVRDCCMYVGESFNKLNITKSCRLQPCQFNSKKKSFFSSKIDKKMVDGWK